MRHCNEKGYMDFGAKIPGGTQADEYIHWYLLPNRGTADLNIIFGRLAPKDIHTPNIFPLNIDGEEGNKPTALKIKLP